MGVRGLTTFLYNHRKELSVDNEIADCRLVIDGHGLMFDLAGYAYTPVALCQEHKSQAEEIYSFINTLRACGIEPYVVFDGPSTLDKRDKVRNTMKENVIVLEGMFHGDDPEMKAERLLPTFSLDTICQTFYELQVPFCFSIEDADAEIVALANKLQCPVLSEDSDFLIFNVENGYLPLAHFEWFEFMELMEASEHPKGIKCLKFERSLFCQQFNFVPRHLPFLSVLMGNDWIPREIFVKFVGKLSYDLNIQRTNKEWPVYCISKWLEQFSDNDQGTESILCDLFYALPHDIRSEYYQRIKTCHSLYTELPDISTLFQILDAQVQNVGNIVKPDNLEDAIRYGFVHFNSYHACNYGFLLLPTAIVCDTKKPSPHLCCREIRDIAIRFLFRRFYHGPSRSRFFIAEYDMKDEEYFGKVRVLNIFRPRCPICLREHLFEKGCCGIRYNCIICNLLVIKPGCLCSDILNNTVEDCFSERLLTRVNIVMYAALYWLKKTKPKPRYVAVLLLSIARCLRRYAINMAKQQDADLTPLTESVVKRMWQLKQKDEHESASMTSEPGDIQELPSMFDSVRTPFNMIGPDPDIDDIEERAWFVEHEEHLVDMDLLHSIAEWECVLWAVFMLYQAVDYDGIHLGLHRIYGSNMAAHEINARLTMSTAMANMEDEEIKPYCDAVLHLMNRDQPGLFSFWGDLFSCFVEFLLQFQ